MTPLALPSNVDVAVEFSQETHHVTVSSEASVDDVVRATLRQLGASYSEGWELYIFPPVDGFLLEGSSAIKEVLTATPDARFLLAAIDNNE